MKYFDVLKKEHVRNEIIYEMTREFFFFVYVGNGALNLEQVRTPINTCAQN